MLQFIGNQLIPSRPIFHSLLACSINTILTFSLLFRYNWPSLITIEIKFTFPQARLSAHCSLPPRDDSVEPQLQGVNFPLAFNYFSHNQLQKTRQYQSFYNGVISIWSFRLSGVNEASHASVLHSGLSESAVRPPQGTGPAARTVPGVVAYERSLLQPRNYLLDKLVDVGLGERGRGRFAVILAGKLGYPDWFFEGSVGGGDRSLEAVGVGGVVAVQADVGHCRGIHDFHELGEPGVGSGRVFGGGGGSPGVALFDEGGPGGCRLLGGGAPQVWLIKSEEVGTVSWDVVELVGGEDHGDELDWSGEGGPSFVVVVPLGPELAEGVGRAGRDADHSFLPAVGLQDEQQCSQDDRHCIRSQSTWASGQIQSTSCMQDLNLTACRRQLNSDAPASYIPNTDRTLSTPSCTQALLIFTALLLLYYSKTQSPNRMPLPLPRQPSLGRCAGTEESPATTPHPTLLAAASLTALSPQTSTPWPSACWLTCQTKCYRLSTLTMLSRGPTALPCTAEQSEVQLSRMVGQIVSHWPTVIAIPPQRAFAPCSTAQFTRDYSYWTFSATAITPRWFSGSEGSPHFRAVVFSAASWPNLSATSLWTQATLRLSQFCPQLEKA